ncbi:hypothetical protein [Catenulispora sp. GAS73]|uniref:hypothetical protein n=1 Tax=Catenulispora sp. GAS73 TaxID=3156269 RepID=UPI003519C558
MDAGKKRGKDWHDRTADRRICAGVYLDRGFRDTALRRVYGANGRIVAPSHGFDLVPVLVHARRALRWAALWDLLTILVFGAALFVSWVGPVLLAVLVFEALVCLRAVKLGWAYLFPAGKTTSQDREILRIRRDRWRTVAFLGVFVPGIVATGLVYFGRRHGVGWPSAKADVISAAIAVCGTAVVRASAAMHLRAQVGALHDRKAFDVSARGRRMEVIDRQQRYLCSLHNGRNPFVGNGPQMYAWSFAQRLVRPKSGFDIPQDLDTEFDKPPFETVRLIDRLREDITKLAAEQNAETRIPGLRVRDHILVESDHAAEFPGALTSVFDRQLISDVVSDPREVVRHHLACSVASWGGDVVTTVFVHVSLQGRTLYVELSAHTLMPVRDAFRQVDVEGKTGFKAVLRDGFGALGRLPAEASGAPGRLAKAVKTGHAMLRARKDKTRRPRPGFEIGPWLSLRELAAAGSGSHFQRKDVIKHWRIIERRLLATVEDFLRLHGVDVSEFMERAMAILNNGIINTGSGDVSADNATMGSQNQVSQTPQSAASPAAPQGQSQAGSSNQASASR